MKHNDNNPARISVIAVPLTKSGVLASSSFSRKPAIKMWIDFGPELGEKKTSAQITAHYSPEVLEGRLVMAVTNFPPRQIGPFMSEVLVLGLSDENGDIVLLAPDHPVPIGERMH